MFLVIVFARYRVYGISLSNAMPKNHHEGPAVVSVFWLKPIAVLEMLPRTP